MKLRCPSLIALALCAAAAGAADRPRLSVSLDNAGAVNENDARAALRVWAAELVRAMHLDLDVSQPLMSSADLLEAVRRGSLDFFAISVPEYRQLQSRIDPAMIVVELNPAGVGEEYVLLVHAASRYKRLADLRGATLATEGNTRMCLAGPWLDLALAGEGLPSAARLFGQRQPPAKLTQVVLPVFFHKVDACLVSRRSFQTMVEMNPQLGRDLRILASSPRVVTGLFAARRDGPEAVKRVFFNELVNLKRTPQGAQILALFQSNGLALRDASCLRPGLEILAAHERLAGAPRGGAQ